jgi:hypothetical protein
MVAVDLRTWAFGPSDGETMAMTRVPLPGRTDSTPLALRELAFGQLCTKVGAPAPYLRTLPAKLQLAAMNWGLSRESSSALLRLAGNEVRAVVSERYAAIDDSFLLEVVDDVLKSAGYRDDALVRAAATGPPHAAAHHCARVRLGGEARRHHRVGPRPRKLRARLALRAGHTRHPPPRLRQRDVRLEERGRPTHAARRRRRPTPRPAPRCRPGGVRRGQGDIARWVKATELLIDNALEEIEGLRAFGLSTSEVQSIGRTLAQDEGLLSSPSQDLPKALRTSTSVFALANAITATARERTDVASRLNLESIGHRYLSAKAS